MDKNIYKQVVLDGIALEKNRVSLSQYQRLGRVFYQVHSDNYKCRESSMFKESELDKAVDRFVELLKLV